ncbi:MAG: hypothetical protein FWD89_03920 [Firmicutes bacterium]|nr:hypothetical protein [Bacillota bacterium]
MGIDSFMIDSYKRRPGYVVSRQEKKYIVKSVDEIRGTSLVAFFENGCILAPNELPMESLLEDPDYYIEEGVKDLCVALWDKGIVTLFSDGHEGKAAQVVIRTESLSPENAEIFRRLAGQSFKEIDYVEADSAMSGVYRREDNKGKGFYVITEPKDQKTGRLPKDAAKFFVQQEITLEGRITSKNPFPGSGQYFKTEAAKEAKFIEYAKTQPFYSEKDNVLFKSKFYYDMHMKYLRSLDARKPAADRPLVA